MQGNTVMSVSIATGKDFKATELHTSELGAMVVFTTEKWQTIYFHAADLEQQKHMLSQFEKVTADLRDHVEKEDAKQQAWASSRPDHS